MKKLFLCLLLGLIGLLNNVNAQKKLNFLVEPEVGLGYNAPQNLDKNKGGGKGLSL